MTVLGVLVGAGAVSWLLRVFLITLVPARKLPDRIRAALGNAGPAAVAALLATELTRTGSEGGASLAPWMVGAAAAAVLAYRLGNLSVTVVGGTLAYAIVAAL
jgi:branched-subunit amino acid transport protein